MGTGSFAGVGDSRGVRLSPLPPLECRGSRQIRAIPLLTLRAFVAYKKGEKPNLPVEIPIARTYVFKCTYFNIKGIMFQFQLRMYVHD
jgi:hypothetical protein